MEDKKPGYIQSEKKEFVRRMNGIIEQAKHDETPEQDWSRGMNAPQSTYAQNLERLHELTQRRLASGEDPQLVLNQITGNLRPPYQDATKARIEDFMKAGATPKNVIDALLEAYKLDDDN